MAQSDRVSTEFKERAQKWAAIGLTPHRPTARGVVHCLPDAKHGISVTLVILIATSVLVAAILYSRPPILTLWPPATNLPAPQEAGRLIV